MNDSDVPISKFRVNAALGKIGVRNDATMEALAGVLRGSGTYGTDRSSKEAITALKRMGRDVVPKLLEFIRENGDPFGTLGVAVKEIDPEAAKAAGL